MSRSASSPGPIPAIPPWTGPLRTVTVAPTPGAPHHTGPITLLTSDITVSAGETFVLSMLGRTPTPVRIGAATQEVFSDDMPRALPNGWSFTLGNEHYDDPNSHNWEGVGLPPDVPVPVFTPPSCATAATPPSPQP